MTSRVAPEAILSLATDHHGNVVLKPSSVGVSVRGCLMQPLDAKVDVSEGQRVRVLYRLIARSAPVGAWSRVEWNGRKFTVVEQPTTERFTAATTHVTAILIEER